MALPINPHSLIETVTRVANSSHSVPDLGVAFGLEEAGGKRG